MRIILAAREASLAEAWERLCGDLADVSVYRGSIFDLSCDAAVSPMDNSFGFMTSGISFQYTARFGWKVQERLQGLVRSRHHGELVVGTADILPTDDTRIPFLIAAPVTRVPMLLRGSVSAYLATRAALLLVRYGSFEGPPLEGQPVASLVSSIAIPGLGTGGAQLHPLACARQVRTALVDVLFAEEGSPLSLQDAEAQHTKLGDV